MIIIHDLSKTQEIIQLQEQAKKHNITFASVSHELRQPLNGSLALIQCAVKHPLTPKAINEKFLLPALHA